MDALTADDITRSFVNSSRSRVRSMTLPTGLAEMPWDDLDFLGWRDRKAASRAYLVTPHDDGVVGLELRAPTGGGRRGKAMCELCRSGHPADEVDLFVAKRTGARGTAGDTVGTYVCADLACSLYVRDLKPLDGPQGQLTVPVEERVEGLVRRVGAFVTSVLA